MSPGTRPASIPTEIADEGTIKAWLDALASGTCDEAAFLLLVQERMKSDPDGSWEVLSQLDQYYRRGKLKTEVFHSVKNALAESALGGRSIPVAHDVAAREPAGETPLARERPMAPDIPAADDIPVATDEVIPQTTARTELGDGHAHREIKQSEDPAGDLKAGTVLRKRYRIESIVGKGSMGTVFQALDEFRLDIPPGGQRLAIKVLHTAVTRRAEVLTEQRREFQQLQLLSHPNILRVFEFDRDGPVVFFTMELLNGASLSRILYGRKHMPLERAQALAAICDIGAAFAYAHSRGMVHGNINPQGVFVTTAGAWRILDFGGSHRSNISSAEPDHEATLPSTTASYASCQVLEGARADARDDVFSLACVAYLLLSGQHPFSKKTAIEAREAGLTPRRPSNLTNHQWRALRAGLAFERANRPANIKQWLDGLDLRGASKDLVPLSELLAPPPPTRTRSISKVAAVAVLVLLAAAIYWIVSSNSELPHAAGRAPTTPAATTPVAIAPAATDPAPANSPAPPQLHNPAAAPASSAATSQPAASQPATSSSAASAHAAPPPAASAHAAPPPAASAHAAPPPATSAHAAPSPAAAVPAVAGIASPGSTRVELASDTIDVPVSESSAQVPVHRKGNLRGEATFNWWTESGTAKPGTNFSPVMPQLARIAEGKSSINLNIPLTGGKRIQSKSFYVVIDQSEGGANLGARTLTMVTLSPSE